MIPARADKKVCPFFLRLRPGFRAPGHSPFLLNLHQTKACCLCIFSSSSQSIGIFLLFMETVPALFPSSTV